MADDDAPWGINPKTGKPYKADPAKMRALRGLRDTGSAAPAGPPPSAPSARAPKPPISLKGTAATYAGKLRSWLRPLGKLFGQRNQVDGVILELNAEALAQAWGQVAVDYPKVGRLLDKGGSLGSLADALTVTALTAGMVMANHGMLKGTPLEPMMVAILQEQLAAAGFVQAPEQADVPA